MNLKVKLAGAALALMCGIGTMAPVNSDAMTIGYYDTSREEWGFDGHNYLSQAKAWLQTKGHTLVSTNNATSSFLSGVDAFYTGLIYSVQQSEIDAMKTFVNQQGGFLFIQTDWASGPWTGTANSILSNWGISHGGSYTNDTGHTLLGTTEWGIGVGTFRGSAHSVITGAPSNFQALGIDDLQRTILGVFDAGAGRSSDVLISTDINMWDDEFGWTDPNNRQLWENIWVSVERQVEPVPEPSTFALIGMGVAGLVFWRRRK